MPETLNQHEEIPANYPSPDDKYLWQRIEAYCAHRWTPRGVVWLVEGCGNWKAPLTPAEITTTEVWRGGSYAAVELEASPFGGLYLPTNGPYRIGATVGGGNTTPDIVLQAFDRLKAYCDAEDKGAPGASSLALSEGSLSLTIRRDKNFIAMAMIYSGAADLLRQYRRA